MAAGTPKPAVEWFVHIARRAYAAWGLSILNYVVPTAATAGLLTVMVCTYNAGVGCAQLWDYRLVLGWFAAVLFVISTGHGSEPETRDNPLGIVLDLIETAAMVFAFHSLGLVMGEPSDAPNPVFFFCIGLYLVSVLVRRGIRYVQTKKADRAKAIQDDLPITILGIVVMAGMLTLAVFYDSIHSWRSDAGIHASWLLWIALLLYLVFTYRREKIV